jgi:hypothetical protein
MTHAADRERERERESSGGACERLSNDSGGGAALAGGAAGFMHVCARYRPRRARCTAQEALHNAVYVQSLSSWARETLHQQLYMLYCGLI